MLAQNVTVHARLWIGPRLSLMEQLTLRSFVACGHHVALWLYGPLEHELPPGVEVCDAARIVPHERVFCYKAGPRPGSYAGFSDLFRYKLLYDCGGWWTDLDVACLKPLDFDQWYAFHPHAELGLVGSVVKAPPRSEVMKCCAVWTAQNVDEWNVVWTRPIRILIEETRRLGLERYVLPASMALADWHEGEKYARPPPRRRRPNCTCCTGGTSGSLPGNSIRTRPFPEPRIITC